MVFEGEMEMFIGHTHQLLKAGMCYFIPAGEQHGWKTFSEAVKIFDVSLKPSDSAVS
jgi:mannose-6-phosphate isomerase-like protein (cupin superfamily)